MKFMEQRMQINLIYHSIRPGGGMERYVTDLVQELRNRNIKLRVIARKVDPKFQLDNSCVDFIIIPDIGFLGRYENIRFEMIARKFLIQDAPVISISRILGQVDIAIKGGTHKGHLLAKKSIITSVYDLITTGLEKSMFKRSGTIVAYSINTQNEIIDMYGVSKAKTQVIYPPVDQCRFNLNARINRDALRTELGLRSDEFMILFPSNDHKRKGAKLLLEASEQIKNEKIKIFVVGKKHLDSDRVTNLGFRADIESLYAAADAVMLASKYEPFGLVGPEAVMCGTRVLMAKGIGCTEVLSDNSCIIFEQSAVSLVRAIKRALNMREKNVLIDPKKDITQDLSIKGHVDRLLNILNS